MPKPAVASALSERLDRVKERINMSLSTCEKCGGNIPLGPDATNRCEKCGEFIFGPIKPNAFVTTTVMEMKMVLDMMMRSILTVEEAQRGLEITHRDLTRQVEWIKDEIRKAAPDV